MDGNGRAFMTRRTRRKYDKAWALTHYAIDNGAGVGPAIVLSAAICKVSPKYLLKLYVARKNETIRGGAQRPCWV